MNKNCTMPLQQSVRDSISSVARPADTPQILTSNVAIEHKSKGLNKNKFKMTAEMQRRSFMAKPRKVFDNNDMSPMLIQNVDIK
jgi:hypothetical protein